MLQTNKKNISLFLGALLIAGLFLFYKKQNSSPDFSNLNPNQFDLKKSNQIQSTVENQNLQAPSTTDAKPIFTPTGLNADEVNIWTTFENILISKNDNDPRMDQLLKHLSPNLKKALFEKYDQIESEKRNDKGLITFLIGRDLKTTEDATFLKKVFEEAPCLSLADCKSTAPEDPHHSSTNQTTLSYPQLVALYEIEKNLSENPSLLDNLNVRASIVNALRQAENFPVPAVHNKARQILNRFKL